MRKGDIPIFIILTATLVVSGFFILINKAQAATLEVCLEEGCNYTSIQSAITDALEGDIINIASGSYAETLNLGEKALTIQGSARDDVIIDASSFTGYAIQNFGNSTTIKDLTLIGTGSSGSSYGFKISHVSDIILENIKVENSYKTGIDLNTVNDAVLNNIEVINTEWGFGLMILDSNDISITDITTSGNAWGGVSVQTKNDISDSIIFNGIFDVQENMPLLLEQDPDAEDNYYEIIDVQIPDKFNYVVYDFREGDDYRQWYYFETLDDSKTIAQLFVDSESPVYSDIIIYDIAEDNYYVIEGMLIQDAINAATSGDTINVAAGTYYERITIGKELTIQSTDGAENTIINGNGVCNNVVNIWHKNVRFEGFTVTNPTAGACADAGGIYVQDPSNLDATLVNNVYVLNNIVEATKNPSEGTSAYGPAGIVIGPSSDVTVSDNIIGNLHNCPDIESDHTTGINVWGNNEATRPFNIIISNNIVSDTDDYGILLEYADNIQIIDNTVSDIEIGIFLNSYGDPHFVSNVALSGNTLQNNDIGIGLKYLNNVITIESNTIKNNAQEGIYIDSAQGNSFDISVHYNDIIGNINYGLKNEWTGEINAEKNYWDAVNPDFDNIVSGSVDFTPWYTNSEMTSLKAPTTTDPVTGDTVLELDEQIDIVANDIIVSMPAGISITATASWQGIINAPSIETVALATPSKEKSETLNIDSVIELGYPDIKLTFSKAVKILLPNKAGKRVGYTRTGESFKEITNVCLDNTQATNDSLPDEGDCKIKVGNDLVIWTKHFTQFIVYSFSPIIIGPTFRAEILPEEEPSALSEEAQKLDINKDDKIDDLDLKELFANWGSIILDNIADFNDDSKVDVFDFNLLMVHWTE